MGLSILDSTTPTSLSDIKAALVALCQGNALPVTSFVPGDPTERWIDITPRLIYAVLGPAAFAVRDWFFDFATDPGDPGDLSADQTPRGGMLSALGAGWYRTFRGQAGYASNTVTIRNDSASPATFHAFDLTFTTVAPEAVKADNGRPTYRNTTSALYSGIGATITLAPGAVSAPLPIQAEQAGSYGSASVNALVCVTQSFGVLTVTASGQLIGLDREARAIYIARCKRAPASNAPGGPTAAYLRAMNTSRDGTPLQRYDGSGPVLITQAYVSPASAQNTVTMYVASATTGTGLDQRDLDSCNANLLGLVLGSNTNPLGVVPDTVGLLPYVYGGGAALPSGTPGAAAAIDVAIPVTWGAKLKSAGTVGLPGGQIPAGTYTTSGSYSPSITASLAVIFAGIGNSLSADILSAGIGGKDQTAGAGVIYTDDLVGDVRAGFAGLYNPTVTTPGTATTAIALGHMGVLGTLVGSLVIV